MMALLLTGSMVYGEAGTTTTDLGNIMFVGDSITHGFKSHSYRWPLHKTLVDNGVKFISVGIHEGNAFKEGSVAAGTAYAGVVFNNRHSAMSSERAYEIAGRINNSGRLGNSNIHDWLGLDATYTGKHRLHMPEQTPDTVVLMIGTNDTFGDYGNKGGIGAGNNMNEAQAKLLGTARPDGTWSGTGDLDVIVDSLHRVNPQVRVLVLTIPTWHDARRNNNKPADYAALAAYNTALEQWAAAKKLELADVNEVLVDPARVDKPGVAEKQFFLEADRLHPTPQGDLLIAECVAHALGVPGRTAGLERRDSSTFITTGKTNDDYAGPYLSISDEEWSQTDINNGFTLTVSTAVGNGATDGWTTHRGLYVHCCHADTRIKGNLTVSESAILWNRRQVLYCGDMSGNTEEIRIVWHPGKAEQNISQGFYVWLGDRLIGEALPADTAISDGNGIYASGYQLSNTPETRLHYMRFTSGCYAPPAN